VSAPGEQAGLCTVKTRLDGVFEKLRQLERDNEVLRGFVQPARDACWCIEFFEPVDLTAPQDEVIRQMFENQCSWRLCNDAMGRLYEYPSGVEFNEQDVRKVFRRNAENEDFVRILIEAQFNIDGAPSLDYLYDGTEIHAENDVRGQIENGHLLRMWGNVRDLSGQKRKEKELSERLDAMRDILSAAPDPILVLREDGVLEAANPAFEWCFGWSVDSQLGRDISAIVQGGKSVAAIIGDMRIVTPATETALQVTCANGSVKTCDARIAALGDEGGDMRAVMTLRDRTDQVNGGAHDAV
jgi:PAS domain S-box-containing protein